MIRICAWIGICAALLGCGPRDTYVCDEDHSAVAHARSLSHEQLSGLSERIIDLRSQYPSGLLMNGEGTYRIPSDLEYLDALSIDVQRRRPTRIKLAGCLDEYIFLNHELDDSGMARIQLDWGGPQAGSEVLWTGSATEDPQGLELLFESVVAAHFQEIGARYFATTDAFERLADAMTQERDVVQVYCDANVAYVETRTSIHYEDENSDVAAPFFELCRFEGKVVANSGGGLGVAFPHGLQNVGPIFMSSHLVRRLDDSTDIDRCTAGLGDELWGACQLPIIGDWHAHFSWEPVCPDSAGSDEGC